MCETSPRGLLRAHSSATTGASTIATFSPEKVDRLGVRSQVFEAIESR
jgi:hypothetical protein